MNILRREQYWEGVEKIEYLMVRYTEKEMFSSAIL